MNYKLGSLFDGSGGFPLAGALCGIEPVWASEIEPYPIAVTRERFPNMKHLGDISKINGSEIEPVDIIAFGSPCQDMSVAGLRRGLKHEANGDEETTRSGLFMEAVRIIKEMRTATNGQYPRFALWENVPGAFSSNQGLDFRLVNDENLEALARLNYEGEYIFAFDDPKYQPLLDKKIMQIKQYIPKPWKLKFYIYFHPKMDMPQLFERVEWCREHECKPYVMRDAACWGSTCEKFMIDYAAYCNQPSFFKNMGFIEFLAKRHQSGSISKEREELHAMVYRIGWEEIHKRRKAKNDTQRSG